jgi:hypothetical protein
LVTFIASPSLKGHLCGGLYDKAHCVVPPAGEVLLIMFFEAVGYATVVDLPTPTQLSEHDIPGPKLDDETSSLEKKRGKAVGRQAI